MDIERTLAQYFKDKTGIQAYLTVPHDPPNEFLVIQLISSAADNQFMTEYSLDVDVWGEDESARIQTQANAAQVIDAIPTLEEISNIFNPRFENLYRTVDADTGRVRYVVQLECSVCE